MSALGSRLRHFEGPVEDSVSAAVVREAASPCQLASSRRRRPAGLAEIRWLRPFRQIHHSWSDTNPEFLSLDCSDPIAERWRRSRIRVVAQRVARSLAERRTMPGAAARAILRRMAKPPDRRMWARRAALYRQGMTLREIATREGVTPASVLTALRRAGVQMRRACRPSGPRPIPYLAQAVRLRRKGLTLVQIGAIVGRTAEAVRQALLRAQPSGPSPAGIRGPAGALGDTPKRRRT